MVYFQLTHAHVTLMQNRLFNFKLAVSNEIDRQLRVGIEEAKNEAYYDKLYERYDADSIDSWLSDTLSELYDWANDTRNKLDEAYSTASSTIINASKRKFYVSDIGYEIEYSLYNGEVSRQVNYQSPNDVMFSWGGLSFEVDGVDFEVDLAEPEFTDWIED